MAKRVPNFLALRHEGGRRARLSESILGAAVKEGKLKQFPFAGRQNDPLGGADPSHADSGGLRPRVGPQGVAKGREPKVSTIS